MSRRPSPALASLFLLVAMFVSSTAFGDPSSINDPANSSSVKAAGIFGEGSSGNLAPDPVSGVLRYSYAFELPRARGRVQPALTLAYSSASRDREAGYGWGLALPTIERRPMSGNPRFDGSPSDERFFFNGEPLVRVCDLPSCPNSESYPNWASAGWRYYRLQVEGKFARFYLSPDRRQWRVQQKGGLRMDFGSADGSLDAVDMVANDPATIVRWRLTRHFDAVRLVGDNPVNYVEYHWKKLGKRGLSYLTDIYDTPRATGHSGLEDFANHVQLAWEAPGYAQTSYVDPLHSTPDLRLRHVGVATKTWEASSAREVMRIYTLKYKGAKSSGLAQSFGETDKAPLWHHSFLESIELEGNCRRTEDANGNIPPISDCIRLPQTKFEYSTNDYPGGMYAVEIIGDAASTVVAERRVLIDESSAAIL